ncbi:unnamed protein product, partial [Staurois parvus]
CTCAGGDATANSTHAEPCPSYLPWYDQVKDGLVFRRCDAEGQWVRDETDMPWRDHSQCENVNPEEEQSQWEAWILSQLRVMYSVGYGISLAALTVALCILTQLRRLRCTRNLIHCNLFVSFILRAVSLLSRDALLMHQHNMIQGQEDMTALLREKTLVGCRVAQTITQYCVAAIITTGFWWRASTSTTCWLSCRSLKRQRCPDTWRWAGGPLCCLSSHGWLCGSCMRTHSVGREMTTAPTGGSFDPQFSSLFW